MSRTLLIGAGQDPHVFELAKRIEGFGHSACVLDASSVENACSIAFDRSGNCKIHVRSHSGEMIPSSAFTSVWFRLKPVIPLPAWGPLELSAAQFAQGEWRTVIRMLGTSMSDAFWMNPVEPQVWIASKPRQLELAASVGLEIPDTVITNDPELVLGLFDRHPRVAYKALNGFVFPDQTGILTREIARKDVVNNRLNILRSPGIYQEFIPKRHELRVTIVGEQIFPALIRTPTSGDGSIDWRHSHFDNIFEECTLDASLCQKLLAFHHAAKLEFGAYDLIAAEDGSFVFLECNPAGQFLWLEYSLHLPILDAIAHKLSDPRPIP